MDYEQKYKEAMRTLNSYTKDEYGCTRVKPENIFPELKESEDERIRNEIIEYLKKFIPHHDYDLVAKSKEWITWLEKQGEQKPIIIIPQFKVGDIIKPKSYNEEHLIKDINENGYVLDVDIIIPFKDEDVWEIVEQKPTWNKEDERNLKGIVTEIEANKNDAPDYDLATYDRFLSWLKSLKDRVQSHQKQGWSEEDNERLLRIHQFIWANRRGDTDEIYQQEQDADWLMTLKPHWKPSEEQLRAIINSAQGLYQCKEKEVLLDLYEQLKKL